MNWRRGLFRAWLLLSVLWIALIGVLNADAVRQEWREHRFQSAAQGLAGVGVAGQDWELTAHNGRRHHITAPAEATREEVAGYLQRYTAAERLAVGSVAVNRRSMDVLAVAENGQWIVTQRARNRETSAELFLGGNQWFPMPAPFPTGAMADAGALASIAVGPWTHFAAQGFGDAGGARPASNAATLNALMAAFIPPALLFVAGVGLGWVLQGFRRT